MPTRVSATMPRSCGTGDVLVDHSAAGESSAETCGWSSGAVGVCRSRLGKFPAFRWLDWKIALWKPPANGACGLHLDRYARHRTAVATVRQHSSRTTKANSALICRPQLRKPLLDDKTISHSIPGKSHAIRNPNSWRPTPASRGWRVLVIFEPSQMWCRRRACAEHVIPRLNGSSVIDRARIAVTGGILHVIPW